MKASLLLLLPALAAAEPRVKVIERPAPRQESSPAPVQQAPPPSAPAPSAPAPAESRAAAERTRVVPRPSPGPSGPSGGSIGPGGAGAGSFYQPQQGGGPPVRVVPGQALRPAGTTTRYIRYVDAYGYPWYGYYGGASYFWLRYHRDYWWWRDPYDRWLYYDRGGWWHPGPSGVVMVPVHDAPQPPAPTPKGGSFRSPDGKRLVEVTGERDDAFLYDNSGTHPVYLKTLASGVERVRFSGGAGGRPLRILLDLKDGTFELFDESGRPLDEGKREPPAKVPPPPPGDPPKIPPPQR